MGRYDLIAHRAFVEASLEILRRPDTSADQIIYIGFTQLEYVRQFLDMDRVIVVDHDLEAHHARLCRQLKSAIARHPSLPSEQLFAYLHDFPHAVEQNPAWPFFQADRPSARAYWLVASVRHASSTKRLDRLLEELPHHDSSTIIRAWCHAVGNRYLSDRFWGQALRFFGTTSRAIAMVRGWAMSTAGLTYVRADKRPHIRLLFRKKMAPHGPAALRASHFVDEEMVTVLAPPDESRHEIGISYFHSRTILDELGLSVTNATATENDLPHGRLIAQEMKAWWKSQQVPPSPWWT